MYQEIKSSVTNKVACIKRLKDNTSIQTNLDNTEYQAYLEWLAEGNTPEPADEQGAPA